MKRLLAFLIVGIILCSCHETKIGSIDLDFDSKMVLPEGTKTYISKPIRIGIEVSELDPNNNYTMRTSISFPEEAGVIKIDDVEITLGEKRVHDFQKKPILWLEIVPSQKGNYELSIDIENAKVLQHESVKILCDNLFYTASTEGIPEKPLIDKKFSFDLLVSEQEDTNLDNVVTRATVIKGSGDIYISDEIINVPSGGEEETQTRTTELVVGKKNTISYVGKELGENIIQFELNNPWGYSSVINIPINVVSPDWNIISEQGNNISIYIGKDNSFVLKLVENDEFGVNEFTGTYRFLEDNIPAIKVNSKEYKQGEQYPLKVGSNVFVVNPKEIGICNIEMIANDKYGKENKDTISVLIDKGVKEIVASVDKSSQTVKVNQVAPISLTIMEDNYEGTFNVKYELLTGSGSFSGGTEQTLAAGAHSMGFTPDKPGTHTYKLTVTDINKQTKVVNITVIANTSALSASINETDKNIILGEKAEVELTASEAEYTGKFYVKHGIVGIGGKFSVNGTAVSSGVVSTLSTSKNTISFVPDGIGTSTVALIVSDEYKQEQNLILRVTTKANVTVTASIGGTASGGGKFGKDESCTVKANPISGYGFTGWYEGNTKVSSELNYTFTVIFNRSLEARYSKNSYTISASSKTGGSVLGSGNYDSGANCTLVATASTGYSFDGWYEENTKVSANASYTFPVTANRSLEARFTLNSHTITATASIGGSVSGGKNYNYGANCTLVATESSGYTFTGWYENDKQVSTNPNYIFQVTGARTLLGKFVLNSIVASVDKSSQTVKVNQVAPISLTIMEDNYEGTFNVKYELLTGSGSFSGGTEQTLAAGAHSMGFTPDKPGTHTYKLTVTDINKQTKVVNITVIANTSALSASVNKNTITCSTNETSDIILSVLEDGYAGNFTIKYQLTGANGILSVNNTELGNGLSINSKKNENALRFKSIQAGTATINLTVTDEYLQSKSATINITANKIIVSTTAQTGGSVLGSGNYDSGANCTLVATASSGYTFTGWYEGNTKVSDSANYSFTVTSDRSLQARFTLNSHTITATASIGGSVSGGKNYNYGANCTLVATALSDYTFTGWYEGNTKVSDSANYSFTVTSDRSLQARFIICSLEIVDKTITSEVWYKTSGSYSYNVSLIGYSSCELIVSASQSSITINGLNSAKATINNGIVNIGIIPNNKSGDINISLVFKASESKSITKTYTLKNKGVNFSLLPNQKSSISYKYSTAMFMKYWYYPESIESFEVVADYDDEFTLWIPNSLSIEPQKISRGKYTLPNNGLSLYEYTGTPLNIDAKYTVINSAGTSLVFTWKLSFKL